MNLSRWGIFLIDLGIVGSAIVLAHLLRFNFEVSKIYYHHIQWGSAILLAIRTVSFWMFKTYSGIIFHTGLEDAKRIFLALASGSLLLALILNPLAFWQTEHYFLPYSVLIIEFALSIFGMTAYRALIKVLYLEFTNFRKEKQQVIIFGAGSGGVLVKQVLDRDMGAHFTVSAFVDDDDSLRKKRLLGVEIFPSDKLPRLLLSIQPQLFIFSTLNIPAEKRQEIVERCLQHNVKVLHVPPVDKWINGELSFRQIREIRIEDLLERAPIQLDTENIDQQIRDRVVLVTGAAGSIGSELARQAIRYHPRKLILLDQAETPLHELELEMRNTYQFPHFEVVVADVRNPDRMRRVFEAFHPNWVFHAAAYKHVPMMENNPSEALLTNVKGTQVTADLANAFGVEKFVLVSTDKAVNPSSIMGATKRAAEIYVQALDRHLHRNGGGTRFITTRFGNVLGSNGSVIPLFKRQIAAGGPVTVTHPEMTRYFMTIPEACQLVMEAAAMGKGGEIFVFDMGKSIRILDLAKRMIRLSGLEPGKDIPIVYSGLRPGEKLYEELLNDSETHLPTHHAKIMIAQVPEYTYESVCEKINRMVDLFSGQNNEDMVRCLKDLIPEYKSLNSAYEQLDDQGL